MSEHISSKACHAAWQVMSVNGDVADLLDRRGLEPDVVRRLCLQAGFYEQMRDALGKLWNSIPDGTLLEDVPDDVIELASRCGEEVTDGD